MKIRFKLRGAWPSLFGGAVILATSPIAPAQVSLKTVVDLAQRHSVAVRLAQADVNKASAQLSQTKDVIIPTVQFSTGIPVFPEVGFTGSPPSIWSATVQALVFSIPQKRYIDAAGPWIAGRNVQTELTRASRLRWMPRRLYRTRHRKQELQAAHQQELFAARLVEIEQQRTEAGVDPLSELLQARPTAAQTQTDAIQHLEGRQRIWRSNCRR